jgi:hypothetical protein
MIAMPPLFSFDQQDEIAHRRMSERVSASKRTIGISPHLPFSVIAL